MIKNKLIQRFLEGYKGPDQDNIIFGWMKSKISKEPSIEYYYENRNTQKKITMCIKGKSVDETFGKFIEQLYKLND